jgi:spermidine/putrescine transport system substrate-binding protein
MKIKSLTIICCLAGALLSGPAAAAEKLFVYNWTEYIPDEVLQLFTKETGIKIIYATYESNESMYAKLKLIEGDGYDLVFPSTYFISKMIKEDMLQPLDHARIPNLKDLDTTLLNREYDPGNRYSLPYMWGSTGIGVNIDLIPAGSVTSWKDLWKEEFGGQLLLQDDMREVFHMALRIKGYSSNSRNPEEIREAFELLEELMPRVLLFNSDSPRLPYLAGEVSIGMIWNGEAWMAREENQAISYVYPSEGANFWVDSFAIPKGAKNIDNAHIFINFMLRPDIAALCVEENGFATPVKTALPLLSEEVRSSEIIFPPARIIDSGEFQTDVGKALVVYQQYWEKLRTGN